jgi:hypothetical protein
MRTPTQFKDNQLVRMLSYPELYLAGFTWIDIPKFEAQMFITGQERGRSAARFTVKDISTGVEYPVFMSDMLTLLTTASVNEGYTPLLHWEVCKKGQNYGLRVAKV